MPSKGLKKDAISKRKEPEEESKQTAEAEKKNNAKKIKKLQLDLEPNNENETDQAIEIETKETKANKKEIVQKKRGRKISVDKIKKIIGLKIQKEFPEFGIFTGTIASYNDEYALYKIVYEDGDTEEMEFHELKFYLNAENTENPKKTMENKGGTDTKTVENQADTNTKKVENQAGTDTKTVENQANTDTKTVENQANIDTKTVENQADTDTMNVQEPVCDTEILKVNEKEAKIEKEKSDVDKSLDAVESDGFEWILRREVNPSKFGCYKGVNLSSDEMEAMSKTTDMGSYKTQREAIAAAKEAMTNDPKFHCTEMPTTHPPFSSGTAKNEQDDEWITYRLVSPAGQRQCALLVKNKIHLMQASKRPVPSTDMRSWKVGFGEDTLASHMVFDECLFYRNPCQISGHQVVNSTEYYACRDHGILYSLQCNSAFNYLMRCFCLEGARITGARYVTKKVKYVYNKTVCWLSPKTLDDYVDNRTIVDTVHAALLTPNYKDPSADQSDSYCKSSLTALNLLEACNQATQTLFINCFDDEGRGFKSPGYTDNAIADALKKTNYNVEVLSLVEVKINQATLEAIGKCNKLKGLSFKMCRADPLSLPSDSYLNLMLRQIGQKLEWLYVDIDNSYFGDECYISIGQNICPNLKFLWIDSVIYDLQYEKVKSFSDAKIIESSLGEGSPVLKTLLFLMINPDKNIESRFKPYIPGRKGNRLDSDVM